MESAHQWPFYVGAGALAAVAVLYALVTGRRLGVSGNVGRVLSGDGRRRASLFLVGLVGGGLIAALTSADGLSLQALSGSYVALFGDGVTALLALFGGGVLVGAGTTLAGGCTSGHGLVGCAHLQPRSLIATGTFLGTAIVVSLLLKAVLA